VPAFCLPDGADIANRLFQETKLMTLEHLAEVRRKMADLQKLAVIRADMAAQCEGGPVPECPVADALSSVSAEA
jgi:MerR family transcriptional regulator, mercuric resistance operon regulatory protein